MIWRIKELVEQQMQKNEELTATLLHQMLLEYDIVTWSSGVENKSWVDL